ncbi:MAG: SBBP repeat-containing protein [Ignavibacteria bacterium]
MEYSTFLGGSSEDRAHGMSIDPQGNVYLTAPIQSIDFPITQNALQQNATGIYLAKISQNGDSLLYSTFIGATGGANYIHGVAIDNEGCIYIAGNTTNSNFPATENAFDNTFNGPANASHGDAFVMKLNPDGTKIIYSTFIGGSGMDLCGKIAVDDVGNAYVIGTTSSTDFPVTEGAFDTTFNGRSGDGRDDIFVAKLNSTGNELIYCTYIGGSSTDINGNNILFDETGSVYFAATTASSDFPTTTNAYDNTYNGGSGQFGAGDGVVVKLNADGTNIEYSTFIGGNGDDFAKWLFRDNEGNIYVCGSADTTNLPITTNLISDKNTTIGYITKFNPQLSQLFFSYQFDPGIQTIAVHKSGNIIVAGVTEADDFPVTTDAFDTSIHGSRDIFISVINPVNNNIIYSTYFGGNNYDVISAMVLYNNSLYLCGNTASTDFPISTDAFDASFNGGTNQWGGDAFSAKFIIVGDINEIKCDYFGQTPPGNSAIVFAPEIISLSNRQEGKITFSPDGKEVFFYTPAGLYNMKCENDVWSEQIIAPLTTNITAPGAPSFSYDGNRLYFDVWTSDYSDCNIWAVDRTENGWGEAYQLPSPANTSSINQSYSPTADGNAYVFSTRPDGFGDYDIWYLKALSGQSFQAENLGSTINTSAWETDPCIAPDGSYLIFSSNRPGGYGSQDLYISFINEENEWPEPVNMEISEAGINVAQHHQVSPSISPDGKYLFFARHSTPGQSMTMDIYWVSTEIIDSLKSVVTAIQDKNEKILDKEIKLNQNYLNPFNPSTNISYSINEPGKVKLEIFDSLGQLVKTLANNYQATGEYSVVWEGKDNSANPLCSGIYFCSLFVNDKMLQKKMILLR